jgi:hypothetical protein
MSINVFFLIYCIVIIITIISPPFIIVLYSLYNELNIDFYYCI